MDQWMFNHQKHKSTGSIWLFLDSLSGCTLYSLDSLKRRSVSACINVVFYKEISKDTKFVYYLTQCDKIGDKNNFAQCKVYNDKLELCAIGNHVKSTGLGKASHYFIPKL